jgi:hypothetical protein
VSQAVCDWVLVKLGANDHILCNFHCGYIVSQAVCECAKLCANGSAISLGRHCANGRSNCVKMTDNYIIFDGSGETIHNL